MNLPVNSCISKRSKIKLSFIVFLLEPHTLKLAHMFHGKGNTTTEKKKNDKGVNITLDSCIRKWNNTKISLFVFLL